MDPVLYWNDVALEANKVSHTNGQGEQTGPPLSARALALVHLAIHDAFVGTQSSPPAQPYINIGPAQLGASPDAAVAAAAHAMLSALFPSQKPFFHARLLQAGLTGTATELNDGNAYGMAVAQALLADRKAKNDAAAVDVGDNGYSPSMARGAHRPDPDNPHQGTHAPFYGEVSRCFSISKKFELDPPPVPGQADYDAALAQVRGKGIAPQLEGTLPATFARRTTDETVMGIYWAYDGALGLGTPPRLYNQVLRKVAVARGNSVAENARLFALANVAMADAGIVAWREKYRHNLWRPVLGVREHHASMGPAGSAANPISPECDPGWLPLGAPATNATGARFAKNFTPPFPAYPSGHATFGAAAFHIARLFYGVTCYGPDSLTDGLWFVSDELNGVNTDNQGTVRPSHARSFAGGLWDMIAENAVSRVYLGVHWMFDGFVADPTGGMDVSRDIGGVPLGIRIAEDIFGNGLAESPA